ncbi:MAG: amidohydrolase family protein, partial [Pseudomonadota bacterium]
VARAGGVTRAFTAPSVVTGVFGGQAALIHLAESGDSLMKAQAAVVAAVGHLGASRSGESRAAAWTVLRETLDDARTYDRNRRMFSISRKRDQRAPLTDIKALVPLVKGDQTLALMADGAGDLRQAIRLKRDYGLELVIIGGSEAWRVADALAEAEIPVVLTPTENLPSHFDALGATLRNAAALEEAGVLFAFIDDGISRAHFLTSLPQMAGNAAANGLSHAAALAAITSSPAEIWGLGDDLGVVEKGKLADLVLWSGDPLEVTSRVRKVFIAGEEQPLRTRQHQLRDRYADLERGDLPFAYRGGSLDAVTDGDAAAAPTVEDAPDTPAETPSATPVGEDAPAPPEPAPTPLPAEETEEAADARGDAQPIEPSAEAAGAEEAPEVPDLAAPSAPAAPSEPVPSPEDASAAPEAAASPAPTPEPQEPAADASPTDAPAPAAAPADDADSASGDVVDGAPVEDGGAPSISSPIEEAPETEGALEAPSEPADETAPVQEPDVPSRDD